MAFFLDDEPTIDDLLDWVPGGRVRELGDMIATCKPPAILGLHADWGAGKTSFLYLLHHYLTGECPHHPAPEGGESKWNRAGTTWEPKKNVAVVWFEAWRYQHEAVPVVALLHEIRAQIPLVSSLFNTAKKLAAVGVKAALANIDGMTSQIGLQMSKLRDGWDAANKAAHAEPLPSVTIRQVLEHALNQVLPEPLPGHEPPRLVVLIDDLDRCDSATAYKLLEGIKIYLNLPNCVFVLGVNQSVIENQIASQLKTTDDPKHLAREYLEKICRNFWPLPAYPPVDDLVRLWLNKIRDGDNKTRPPGDQIEGNYVGRIAAEIKKFDCLPHNPRKIKAYTNTLAIFLARPGWNRSSGHGDDDYLNSGLCIFLAYLAHFFPDMYRVLSHQPAFFELIHEWCETPSPKEGTETPALHETFRGVRLAWNVTGALASEAVPITTGFKSAFRDPARGNVFRAQALVLELRKLGVTPAHVEKCMLR